MKVILLFAVLAFTLVSAQNFTDCTRNEDSSLAGGNEVSKVKYPNPNACSGTTYCVNFNQDDNDIAGNKKIPANELWVFMCVDCISDCDCDIGEYCVTGDTRLDNYGTCQSYTDKLGTDCVPFTGSGKGTFNVQDAYHADQRVCAIFGNFTDTVGNVAPQTGNFQTLWEGTCIEGVCKECNSYLVASAGDLDGEYCEFCSPFSNAQPLQQLQCAFQASGVYGDNSQGVFNNYRKCSDFKWVKAAGMANTVSLLFVVALAIMVVLF